MGLSSTHHVERSSRRSSHSELVALTSSSDERHDVLPNRLVYEDISNGCLHLLHGLKVDNGVDKLERMGDLLPIEDRGFGNLVRVAKGHTSEKPVELCFGQRISSRHLDRILSRDHAEGHRQDARLT